MKSNYTFFDLEKLNKIYHISDIHIRNFKRHDEYSRVFDRLNKYITNTFTDDSLILLTGDIVHSKTDVTPELVNIVQEFLRKLCNIGPVLMIPGNHDANLNNSHRMDALTPIVKALNHPNLVYLIDTCVITIADIMFIHWSVFDKPEKYIKPDKLRTEYKICLYHGPVTGVQIKENAQLLDQCLNISDFDGFDFGLFGDIHTRQFLNEDKTIGYPGSLIQQNHGETIGKGILVWDLNNRSAEYVEIENDTSFYTIYVDKGKYDKLPSDLSKNLYLRIRHKNTSQSTIKDIISDVKEKYNVIETSIQKINDLVGEFLTHKIHSIDVRDLQYQNQVLSNYLEDNFQIDKDSILRILEINSNLNNALSKSEVPRNSMWIPKKFEFDNMFSYGKGNQIDFSNMEGTYGIFAPNASGKSTLLDSITYCIFDKCSKTSKAAQVMNNQSHNFHCKLVFELHGKEYTIERKGIKQKQGNVKVNVDFSCKDGEEITSLNGKDRSDTNANIRSIMGNYEDFILTALSVQNNNTGFIDMSQSDRKDLLSQFLDINIYEELYQLANNESRDLSVLLKQHQKEDYHDLLKKANYDMETFEIQIEEKTEDKNNLVFKIQQKDKEILEETKELIKLNSKIQNIDNLNRNKKGIEDAVTKLHQMTIDRQKKLEEIESTLKEKIDNLSKSNREQINEGLEDWKTNRELLTKKNLELTKASTNLWNSQKKMEKLAELKYDENCSFCMNNIFVKDAIETKKNIVNEELVVNLLENEAKELKFKVDELKEWQGISNFYDDLEAEIGKFELEKSKLELEINKIYDKIRQGNIQLQTEKDLIKEYYDHLESIQKNEEVNKTISSLQTIKNEYEDSLTSVNKQITNLTIEYKLTEKNRDSYQKSIDNLRDLELKFKDYQMYLTSTHRDGIPHTLIASIIPSVEEEINNILSQIVDFQIVLQAEDKSINAYIAYSEDNYWPLELTSGMEKFIASLAIRTSLINVSSLPKPNFLAIDEGFGALDSTNLSSMIMLFDYLKTQFKFIMIISHIDSMRDVVDSHIEINKIKGKSKIEHI